MYEQLVHHALNNFKFCKHTFSLSANQPLLFHLEKKRKTPQDLNTDLPESAYDKHDRYSQCGWFYNANLRMIKVSYITLRKILMSSKHCISVDSTFLTISHISVIFVITIAFESRQRWIASSMVETLRKTIYRYDSLSIRQPFRKKACAIKTRRSSISIMLFLTVCIVFIDICKSNNPIMV